MNALVRADPNFAQQIFPDTKEASAQEESPATAPVDAEFAAAQADDDLDGDDEDSSVNEEEEDDDSDIGEEDILCFKRLKMINQTSVLLARLQQENDDLRRLHRQIGSVSRRAASKQRASLMRGYRHGKKTDCELWDEE